MLQASLHRHAVPSIFPWPTKKAHKRRNFTSMKAAACLQECSSGTEECLNELNIDDSPCIDEGACHDKDKAVLDHDAEIEKLRLQVKNLQDELEETKKEPSRSLFRLENIKDNDYLVKYYTGFPDYTTLIVFYR